MPTSHFSSASGSSVGLRGGKPLEELGVLSITVGYGNGRAVRSNLGDRVAGKATERPRFRRLRLL